jgi:hypothetical protein
MTIIRIGTDDLSRELLALGLDQDSVQLAVQRLSEVPESEPVRSSKRLMYLGGCISLFAVTLGVGEGWRRYGAGVGAIAIGVLCISLFVLASALLRRGWEVPSGLAATVAIGLVPLMVFATTQAINIGTQHDFGEYRDFYFWVSSQFAWMEIATLGVTMIAVTRFRLPILVLPAMVCSWFFSMDATGLLFRNPSLNNYLVMFSAVATVMFGLAFALDHRGHRFHATWLHLGALLTIGGVGCASGDLLWWALGGLAIAGLGLGIVANRSVYFVFGGLWAYSTGTHLAIETFGGGVAFPMMLLVAGGTLVALAMRWSKSSESGRL